MKAIAAYRRTLAIDSEDVTAHFGLAQAFHDPAWGRVTVSDAECGCKAPVRSRSIPTGC